MSLMRYGFTGGLSKLKAFVEQAKLLALDVISTENFGSAVSISGDGNTALVGVPNHSALGSRSGAAYVFLSVNGTWSQQQKLLASDGAANDNFGYSVVLSDDGNMALVGAHNDADLGTNSGAVYIFTRSSGTWTQTQKLVRGGELSYFGYSLALSEDGNTALIGTIGGAGSAYIFILSGGSWVQQQILTANDGVDLDYFGHSVSLSTDGNTALIGAPQDDDLGSNSGSAYVFTRSSGTWTQQQKLVAGDGAASAKFGLSVSISGDGSTALIGVKEDNDLGGKAGAAYVFTRSSGTWTQQQKLVADDGLAGDSFGNAVYLSRDGNAALLGAQGTDDLGSSSGSAYVFIRSSGIWTQNQKLLAGSGLAGDALGGTVSLSRDGTTALVGAIGDDTIGSNAGAAYIFVRGWTPKGQYAWTPTDEGSTMWTVPVGVTSLSVLTVGSGGRFSGSSSNPPIVPGNGGNLTYANDVPVVPGEELKLECTIGATVLWRGATPLVWASGNRGTAFTGSGLVPGTWGTQFGGLAVTASGVGVGGAGGAAGYTGEGGAGGIGGSGGPTDGQAGSGGGGGGGCGVTGAYGAPYAGGGVGLKGQGANGVGGTSTTGTGRPGSAGVGANYGGGGFSGLAGSVNGAIRIMWGGGRSYPSNAGDM